MAAILMFRIAGVPWAALLLASISAAEGQSQDSRQAGASEQAFNGIAAVLNHPRCLNCHVRSDRPRVGERGSLHQPLVARGKTGSGAPGMPCAACHGARNFDPGRVPGAPKWKLAPRSAGWDGLTIVETCRNLKDRKMNGGMSAQRLVRHVRTDPLVLWAWRPGAGREPVPMPYREFAELFEYWVKTGAVCPSA